MSARDVQAGRCLQRHELKDASLLRAVRGTRLITIGLSKIGSAPQLDIFDLDQFPSVAACAYQITLAELVNMISINSQPRYHPYERAL